MKYDDVRSYSFFVYFFLLNAGYNLKYFHYSFPYPLPLNWGSGNTTDEKKKKIIPHIELSSFMGCQNNF